jgi:hypothetical protein
MVSTAPSAPDFSPPAADAADGPAYDKTRSQEDEEDYRPGGGDSPAQKSDADVFHVLEHENQRQDTEYDA